MSPTTKPLVEERVVHVTAGPVTLDGTLRMPEGARAIVLFAHGSGSSRRSPRNVHVARMLNAGYLATLLIDLLTADEEVADLHTAHLRFDIGLLAERLVIATDWLTRRPDTGHLAIGYFGASTGWSSASNGITCPSTAVGLIWPNPNSAFWPLNASTAAFPTSRPSSTKSPPGSASEIPVTLPCPRRGWSCIRQPKYCSRY
jgi:hypothetical protein